MLIMNQLVDISTQLNYQTAILKQQFLLKHISRAIKTIMT